MKSFITLTLITITLLCLINPVSAESKDDGKAFEEAAEKYEILSKKYETIANELKTSKPENAAIYKKVSDNYEDMADIKEDAARDAKRGKWGKADWEKYEKLSKENEEYLKLLGHADKGKYDKEITDKHQVDDSSPEKIEKRIGELELELEYLRKKLKHAKS